MVLDPEQAQTGRGGKTWGVMDMRRALRERLAGYKIPQELRVLEGGIPKNAMGKGEFLNRCLIFSSGWMPLFVRGLLLTWVCVVVVNKKALIKEVFGERA